MTERLDSDSVAHFKAKLTKPLVSKGVITPSLLVAHKRLQDLKRTINQRGRLEDIAEILNPDAIREHQALEAARAYAEEEGIDLEFIQQVDEETLLAIDTVIAEEARKNIRKIAA